MSSVFWFVFRHSDRPELLERGPELWEVEDTIEGLARRDSEPVPGSCPRSPPIPPMHTAPGVPWWRDYDGPRSTRFATQEAEPEPEAPRHRWPERQRPEPPRLTDDQYKALERTPEQIAAEFAAAIARF
jgi:hypothetical protein